MKKKRSMRRGLAVILAAWMLAAVFPGAFLGASAAEDMTSQDEVQTEQPTEAGENTEKAAQAATEEAAQAASEAAVTPVIALDYVPAYGVNSPVTGVVFTEDGSAFDPEAYRISVFLQIYEGGTYWRKPYNDHPYTELGDDGSFSAVFNTGGEDINARFLHIMLVPSDYTPTSYQNTNAIALDHVTVVRTENGDITVTPERVAPPPGNVQPAINALLPVAENKIAVDVGFYTDGSGPGSSLSEALIRQQLEAVSAFSDTVRFYKAGGEEYKAYKIAREMGFNIVGTAYLCGKEDEDKAEMDALIEHCNNGLVDVAVVGNETLLDTGNGPKLTARQLVSDIQYVRAGLTDSSIPVSTSDSVDVLLANSSVRNACNLIMPNCYPFWGRTHIDNAAAAFVNSINALKAVSGGKQVLISETGWPTDGGAIGSAVPNEENAAKYYEQIREWSLSTGTQVLYFDAADEPWKAGPGGEGDVGSHWGFMTTQFELKDSYKDLNPFDLEPLVVSGITDKTYTGSAVTQNLTVKAGSVTLSSGTDYTVSYSNNVNIGEAAVTVTGKGSYSDRGTVTKKFLILPGATSKVTAKNVKTGIKLSWEKVEGATHYNVYRGTRFLVTTSKLEMTDQEVVDNIGQKYTYKVYATKNKIWDSPKARSATMYRLRPVGIISAISTNPGKMTVKYDYGEVCTGYVVRYGLKSDMSDAKVLTVSGAETTTKTFSNLTKGKTYYVQARTYKLENGTRYYSAYSLTKSVKIMGDRQAANTPVIALTYVPEYGSYKDLKGKVFMKDGSAFRASDYRIAMFIQIVDEGGYYIPKPTYAYPYVDLSSDGSFIGDFTTGGVDETARYLHVLLIPASAESDTFEETKAKAVDYVKITRTDSGGITISPRRIESVPVKTVTNSAAGKITVTYGKSANASGYVIRYGLKSDMSDAKAVTVSSAGTTSKTISGLTKGKTYYVQVRASLLENGKRIYSDFSAKKFVKITK